MEQTFVQDGATATAENGKGKGSRPPPLLPSAVTGGAGGVVWTSVSPPEMRGCSLRAQGWPRPARRPSVLRGLTCGSPGCPPEGGLRPPCLPVKTETPHDRGE